MSEKSLCVALTGSTGFVGRHVLAQLLSKGHTVRALVRSKAKVKNSDGRVVVIEGDLFDEKATRELLRGADAVIHLVGIIMENPGKGQTFERVHVEATRNLLAAAKVNGRIRKWVHMSALGTRPQAVATYHRTKWEAEELVRASGLDFTIFRPSIIHGADGEFMHMVKDFWCKMFPPFVPYFGAGPFGTKGAGKLQPVHVDDVAACFVDALTNAKARNEMYPMGGPDAVTWPELYATVGKYLPGARKKPIIAMPAWKAKMLSHLPMMPFNWDQVVMSQEDSTCSTAKVENDFGITLKPFEETVKEYAGRIE